MQIAQEPVIDDQAVRVQALQFLYFTRFSYTKVKLQHTDSRQMPPFTLLWIKDKG